MILERRTMPFCDGPRIAISPSNTGRADESRQIGYAQLRAEKPFSEGASPSADVTSRPTRSGQRLVIVSWAVATATAMVAWLTGLAWAAIWIISHIALS